MSKASVNLILSKKKETKLSKKLKLLFPLIAGISLFIFIILFIISLTYVNSNINKFNLLKKESERLEAKISAQKSVEGIYTVSLNRLSALDTLLTNSMSFIAILPEITAANGSGISLSNANVSEKGNLAVSLQASSSASLDDFVTFLKKKEEKKLYSEIIASSILREKKGIYHLGLTFKVNKSLIQ
jgi:hypothetical protein